MLATITTSPVVAEKAARTALSGTAVQHADDGYIPDVRIFTVHLYTMHFKYF